MPPTPNGLPIPDHDYDDNMEMSDGSDFSGFSDFDGFSDGSDDEGLRIPHRVGSAANPGQSQLIWVAKNFLMEGTEDPHSKTTIGSGDKDITLSSENIPLRELVFYVRLSFEDDHISMNLNNEEAESDAAEKGRRILKSAGSKWTTEVMKA